MNSMTDFREEALLPRLSALYRGYGYTRYKMSKFEEYDLYAGNKDFLISDHVITFTDTNGKLMAMKPDVTLSIIKNSREEKGLHKVYYNENVYRVSGSTAAFKEIMQSGLECIGALDDWAVAEVVLLAAESLAAISSDFVLDLSDLDIVSDALSRLGVDEKTKQELLLCVGEKNPGGAAALCAANGANERESALLCELITLPSRPDEAIVRLKELLSDEKDKAALARLERIANVLQAAGFGDRLCIDFSVVHDMKYYNGIVFRGFVNGVPTGVLSGGQYDRLMQKMGRRAGAIGFAVYLDLLERLFEGESKYDTDVVLLYDEKTDLAALALAVKELSTKGERVVCLTEKPEQMKYKRLLRVEESGVFELEANA